MPKAAGQKGQEKSSKKKAFSYRLLALARRSLKGDEKSTFSIRATSRHPCDRLFFTYYNGPAVNATEAYHHYLQSSRRNLTNAYINGVKVAKEGFAFSRSRPARFVLERDTHLYLFKHFPILPHGGVE